MTAADRPVGRRRRTRRRPVPPAAGRARDRGEAAAVSNGLQRGGRRPAGSVHGLGGTAPGDLANKRRPVAVVVRAPPTHRSRGRARLFSALAVAITRAPRAAARLDEQATRDSAGSVDDDPAAALDPESLVGA